MGDGPISSGKPSLLLSNSNAQFVESVGHDDAHSGKVVGRTETASGEIALWEEGYVSYLLAFVEDGLWRMEEVKYFVLYGFITPRGWEVLSHELVICS